MLNEIKEYEQYTRIDDQNTRLKYPQISNSFSGIDRALCIIARNFIFMFDHPYDEDMEDAEQYAKLALKLWCGETISEEAEIPEKSIPKEKLLSVRNGLPRYIKHVHINAKINEYESFINKPKQQQSIFPDALIQTVEDIRKVLYTKEIVAGSDSDDIAGYLNQWIESLQGFRTADDSDAFQAAYKGIIKPLIKSLEKLKKLKFTLKGHDIFDQVKLTKNIARLDEYLTDKSGLLAPFDPYIQNLKASLNAASKDEVLLSIIDEIESEKERQKDNVDPEQSKSFNYLYNQYIAPIVNASRLLEKLKTKRKNYAKALFNSEIKETDWEIQGNNTFKTITYDGIIAKAFCQGPLRRWYLCCDDSDMIEELNLSEKEKDVALKTISAWLLGRSYEDQDSVMVVKADITNWSVYNDSEDFKPEKISVGWPIKSAAAKDTDQAADQKEEKSRHLFRFSTLINVTKLSALKEWRDHFIILEESELDKWLKEHEKGIFCSDAGACLPLCEGEKYI